MRKDYLYFGIFLFVIGFLIAAFVNPINLYNSTAFPGLSYGIAIMIPATFIIAFGLLSQPKNTPNENREKSFPSFYSLGIHLLIFCTDSWTNTTSKAVQNLLRRK
jgi:hypothetical protein